MMNSTCVLLEKGALVTIDGLECITKSIVRDDTDIVWLEEVHTGKEHHCSLSLLKALGVIDGYTH